MKRILVLIVSAVLGLSCASTGEFDFYISPDGNDNDPGTENEPFATLDRARLAVRELKKTKQGDITVGLKGGKYILRKTVVFTIEDSGEEGQKITYKAVEGEEPVLTSEAPVSGWTKLDEGSGAYPAQAEGNLWSASLPEGAGRIKYLFKGNEVLPRSMTKGFIPPVKYKTWAGINSKPETRNSMKIPDGIISDWENVQDMELVIIPTCDWTLYNRPLEAYNPETHVVQTPIEAFYGLGAIRKSNWDGTTSAWFANCPEGMREESNWYVNTRENKIYLFSSSEPENISVPMLLEYIRVDGEAKPDSEPDVLVENIHFEGLVFTKGKRFSWDRGYLEPKWEYIDVTTALLRFRNAKNCSVTACSFENSGASAVRLDLSSQNNRVEGNHMKRLGGVAISIIGYEEGKDSNFGNEIIGNHIHHIGEAYWGAHGVTIEKSSKNRIAHNLIHHTPYTGLQIEGFNSKDNIVEYNELYRVVDILGDGNAFYISHCGINNQFRYNYIHDITNSFTSAAMRTDGIGTAKEVSFIGNIVHNSGRGGLVLKGPGHKSINNIFVDCLGDALEKGWEGGKGWLEIRCGGSDGTVIKDNIFYATFNSSPLFMKANTNESMPQRFKDKELWIDFNKIDQQGNICYSTILDESRAQKIVEDIQGKGFQLDYKDISAISADNGRIVINPESELFKEGYEFIDMNKIGLPESFPEKWLEYNPEMSMSRYLEKVTENGRSE